MALTVLAIAQFMVVLDVTIVNVALPAIQSDLGFSAEGLQWVVNGYTLAFGGLLLLGGRASDLLGRRRLFLAGLALFGVASLAGGFVTSSEGLIAARVIQGVGAALLSPAALALLTVTFPAGRERNIALGVWGALAGIGGTLGVVAGGVLVDSLGWEWIFFVNVPIAILALIATPMFVTESRREGSGNFDFTGAVLGTAGLLALVYGVIRTDAAGWGSAEVLGLFGAALVLLGRVRLRRVARRRPARPAQALPRARAERLGARAGAQRRRVPRHVLHDRALPAAGARRQRARRGRALRADGDRGDRLRGRRARSSSRASARARPTWPARRSASPGCCCSAAPVSARATPTDILPGLIVFGLGLPLVGVANQIAAIAEVPHEDAGAASGVVTAAFQVGGAIGLALVSTAATSRVSDAVAAGVAQPEALAQGFERGLLVAAGLAVANLVVGAVRAPKIKPDAQLVAEAAAG